MMRYVTLAILAVVAGAVGWVAFDWYRTLAGEDAYGAPFELVDQKGQKITQADFRAQPLQRLRHPVDVGKALALHRRLPVEQRLHALGNRVMLVRVDGHLLQSGRLIDLEDRQRPAVLFE